MCDAIFNWLQQPGHLSRAFWCVALLALAAGQIDARM